MLKAFKENPRQLLRSWYMFAHQIPFLPEMLLGSMLPYFFKTFFRGWMYNKEHFTDEDLNAFVEAFQKANANLRPNFMAVGGYDGMRVIYEALKATKGVGGVRSQDIAKHACQPQRIQRHKDRAGKARNIAKRGNQQVVALMPETLESREEQRGGG